MTQPDPVPPHAPVLLITGAAGGIGAAVARAAASQGHRLVLIDAEGGGLATLVGELGAEAVLPLVADVGEWRELEDAVGQARERFGRIDAVLATAGINGARGFQNESPEAWRRLVLTNVLGLAFTIRATLPALRESAGQLVALGSTSARQPLPGSIYAASARAAEGLLESARLELHGSGVRVTTLLAGTVNTAFFDNPQADALDAADVADTVLWALGRPRHVDVNEVVLRAVTQER